MRIVAIFLVFIFAACSSSPVPRGIVEPVKMQKVVNDLIQVDEYINNFLLKDTTLDIKKKRSVLYEQVFLLHNTTRKDFFTSFNYYKQHPDLQKVLFDSLYNNLNKGKDDTTPPKVIKPIAVQ